MARPAEAAAGAAAAAAAAAAAPCSRTSVLLAAVVAFATLPGRDCFVVTPGRSTLNGLQQLQQRRSGVFSKGQAWDGKAPIKASRGRLGDVAIVGSWRDRSAVLRMGAEGYPSGDGEDVSEEYVPWSAVNRKAIGAMATLGALESAYLTYQKLNPAGMDLLCGASGGCLDVLNGPYSNVLGVLLRQLGVLSGTELTKGVPLTIPGMLGYTLVAALALAPLSLKGEAIDKNTRSLLLMVTTAMGVFAVYLMSLLKFKIGYPCPWCLTSAGLSLSMCAVAWTKRAVPEKTKAVIMGACTTLVTAFACLTIFVVTETALDIRQAEASPGELVGLQLVAAPQIDTDSSPQALRLAKKLKSMDAKMYGAYWCTHCFNQKELLGKQAMANVKYVECSNRGVDNQVGLCKAADIPGFPTWDIDGKLYPGEQTLEELEEIVGLQPFKG